MAEARSWLGTPYHHKARVKGVGVDCGGLLYEVYSTRFSLEPYPGWYAMDWALHRSDELYLDFLRRYICETHDPAPADIVVFRIGRTFSHGGILTERSTVVHAWGAQQRGLVMESPFGFFTDRRRPRLRKFFKVNFDE